MNLELVLKHTSDGIVATDAALNVTAVNPRAESLLRRPVAELLGRSLHTCIPDFEGSPGEAELRQYAAGYIERRLEHFSPSLYVWLEMRVVPDHGGVILFLRDVTDRARQMRSEAVREAVREVLINAPIAITITRGPGHRYELINRFAQELIGNRQVDGKKVRDAFPDVDPALFAVLDEVYRSGARKTVEDLYVEFERDGERRKGWFDVTYQPLFDTDGSVSGILTISVETTAYREERQRIRAAAS